MQIDEIELKRTIHDFNSLANDLMDSYCNNFNGLLIDFVRLLQENRIIQEFIKNCGEPNQKLVDDFINEPMWRTIRSLGDSREEQVSNIFSILQNITENKISVRDIIISFSKSTSVQECLNGFKNQVIKTLISSIKQHLERECIDNEYDIQKMIQQITISGNYGNVNVAAGNNATATLQNNSIDLEELNKLIKNIQEKLNDLSENEKEILENSLGIIKEEANSKEPKSKTISFALKTINSIKYVGELFILIQKLNEVIAPFLS
ncbi:MAG: hypothetical protein IKQ24_00420 [Verrucomicrobia bacterium]|nr:hypothetical protein [Verrucomicrobiota bacterium]